MINHTEAIAIAQVDIIDISRSKVLYRMYEQQGGPLRTFYASQKVPGVHEDIKNIMPM